MEEKQSKKIKRFLEDIVEERDDILESFNLLINTANVQVQSVLNTQVSLSQKEAVLKYLTRILSLFTELNHSVLKFLDTERLPVNPERVKINPPQSTHDSNILVHSNLNCDSKLDISDESPSFSKKLQIDYNLSHNSDHQPLENLILNNVSSNNDSNVVKVENESDSRNSIQQIQNNYEFNEQTSSPPFIPNPVKSEVFTVNSTSSQHPSIVLKPHLEISRQYDDKDLSHIKENIIFLNNKLLVADEKIIPVPNELIGNLPKSNVVYELPVKEVLERKENSSVKELLPNSEKVSNTITISGEYTVDYSSSDSLSFISVNNKHTQNGPSSSTETNSQSAEDLMGFSTSTSESERHQKVDTWLNNNKILQENSMDNSNSLTKHSASEKLQSIKRTDRHGEAREEALKNIPNFKFVSVEATSMVKNDLNSYSSSTGKKKRAKDKKTKHLNEDAVNEIKQMALPTVGTVCVFSHIVSPNEFYLQVVDDESSFYMNRISENFSEKFRKIKSQFRTKKEAFEKLGKYCAGYVCVSGEKQAWYRLQILDWKLGSSSPEVLVQGVDFGFKSVTSYEHLQEITKDVANIPALAIKCHFPLLYPQGSTYSNRLKEWSEMAVNSMCDIVSFHNDMDNSEMKLFELSFAMLEEDSLAVDLTQFGEPNADTLGKILVDCGLAVEIIDEYEENPELGHFLEDLHELERAENVTELVLGYDAQDEKRVCRFARADGTCYKGKNCHLEHLILKDGYTTDKSTVFNSAINFLILPVKGETVHVLVTEYIDSCSYLVQMVRNPFSKPETNFVMDRSLSVLMDSMNNSKTVANYEKFKAYPAVGEIILAYQPLFKLWLRVAVRELNFDNSEELKVYSVDFGNLFTVRLKDTRVMKEDFMHLPFQVVQVYLDKYQHKKSCDSRKAKRFFDKHIFYKNFMAHIQSNDSPFKVTLTTFRGQEIGPTLVKEGFAESRDKDLHISDEGQLSLE